MSIERGDGWAAGHLDDMGEGPGFRKIRRELDVREMGVNAIVLPPGIVQNTHWHERQEELYFLHSGELEIEFGDGTVVQMTPGSVARVDAATRRTLRNRGTGNAVYVIVGAHGGYVGRDGLADPDQPRLKQLSD
jgi:uncharacterized cupin superfamily protein